MFMAETAEKRLLLLCYAEKLKFKQKEGAGTPLQKKTITRTVRQSASSEAPWNRLS